MKKAISFFIGLLLVFISIEVLTRVSAYVFIKIQNQKNVQEVISDKKIIRIVAIGESTTAVAANAENTLLVQDTSYPYALEKYLNKNSKKYTYKIDNKGIMSGNSMLAITELENYLLKYKPNLIVSMLGMKDHLSDNKRIDQKITKELKDFFLGFKTISLIMLYLEQYELNKNNIYDSNLVKKYSDLNLGMKKLSNHIVTRSIYQQGIYEKYSLERYKEIIETVYLANYFFYTGQLEKAEKVFLDLIEKKKFGYFNLVDLYISNNNFKEAEQILFRYRKEKGENPFYFAKLIKLYIVSNQWDKVNIIYNNVNSSKLDYLNANKIAKSELDLLHKKYAYVISELNNICGPKVKLPEYVDNKANFQIWLKNYAERDLHDQCLFIYSEASFNLGYFDVAENGLRELIKNKRELNTGAAFNLLLKIHYKSNNPEKAEDLINFMIGKNKRLGEYYAMLNHYKMYQQTPAKLEEFEDNIVKTFTTTVGNYKKLYSLAQESGVKLMIMQYPTFPISMMKKIVSAGNENHQNIIFFSNEHVFDNYAKSDVFFEPRYPYNFNHYTKKGAELLAEHIGKKILLEFEGIE